MRDLSRLLTIFRQAKANGVNRDASLLYAFNTCYLMREGVNVELRKKCIDHIVQSGLIDSNALQLVKLNDSNPLQSIHLSKPTRLTTYVRIGKDLNFRKTFLGKWG